LSNVIINSPNAEKRKSYKTSEGIIVGKNN